MKLKPYCKIYILFITTLLFGVCLTPLSLTVSIDQNLESCEMITEGQILYAPMYTTTTFLREADGQLNHTWSSSYLPGVAVCWLGGDEEAIIRTIRTGFAPFAGGAGGGVQIVEWDGTVVWDFRYNTNGKFSHHDIEVLPNGNVLMIAWEYKSRAQAIQAGRNPNTVSNQGLYPDHIIEVEPTGPTSGDIVWEWHAWDHLIQDYDSSKDNYGVVGDHPELLDINYGTSSQQSDMMHTNSVDYNEDFDQILISVCNYNEIWIIDHSTTTEEATGHSGGNYDHGGDLLYRWGNPRTYDAGTTSDQKLFGQHDASWIKEGYLGEGNILIFNNGGSRHYSSVDEIIPPVDENGEYYLEEGEAYEPESQTWIYTASPPGSMYTGNVGGAHRLPNGNTLISTGNQGKILEVTPDKQTVWQYNVGQIFKVCYIAPEVEEPPIPNTPDLDCSGSLSWSGIDPGRTVTGSFYVKNIGDTASLLNWTVITSSISWGTWTFIPESGEGLTPEDGEFEVQISVIAPDLANTDFDGYLRIENQNDSTDYDVIPVYLKTPRERTINFIFLEFLKHYQYMFQTLKLLNQIFNK